MFLLLYQYTILIKAICPLTRFEPWLSTWSHAPVHAAIEQRVYRAAARAAADARRPRSSNGNSTRVERRGRRRTARRTQAVCSDFWRTRVRRAAAVAHTSCRSRTRTWIRTEWCRLWPLQTTSKTLFKLANTCCPTRTVYSAQYSKVKYCV